MSAPAASSDCTALADALRRAWPQVRRVGLRVDYDGRSPRDVGGEWLSDVLIVSLSVSAPAGVLVGLDLVTREELDSVAPQRSRRLGSQRSHAVLTLQRTCVRLDAHLWQPSDSLTEFDTWSGALRVWNAVVRALAPSVWTPPRRGAAAPTRPDGGAQ